jgi:putative ABC transport system ATP-binding protein
LQQKSVENVKLQAELALSFQSVFKRYRKDLPLLEGISFNLNHGEIVVIAGPSGSGKSTILQIASGLLLPDSGNVEIDGIQLTSKNERQISQIRRSILSYIPQDDYLFETLTVQENVALAFDLHGEKRAPEKIRKTLSDLGIEKLASREISEISAGERRRASIARGMVRNPRILIIDEPTSSLDIEKTLELMKTFKEISSESNASFLIASHDVNELKEFSDRVYEIRESRLFPIQISRRE